MDSWAVTAWGAFGQLHKRRQAGMASNPIPVSEARSFLEVYGFTGDGLLELMELVLALDDAWLEWARTKDSNGS